MQTPSASSRNPTLGGISLEFLAMGPARRVGEEDVHMTMPTDAADAVRPRGVSEGPRDHQRVDTDHVADVDDDNVPHPGDANEAS